MFANRSLPTRGKERVRLDGPAEPVVTEERADAHDLDDVESRIGLRFQVDLHIDQVACPVLDRKTNAFVSI
jgi:hypothetical protein